eukprot:9123682-Pyramimonas_sp.AAC.1
MNGASQGKGVGEVTSIPKSVPGNGNPYDADVDEDAPGTQKRVAPLARCLKYPPLAAKPRECESD